MVVIIDYDAGNIKSVEKAIQHLGSEVVLSNDKNVIKSADRVILPGVGAFGHAMKNLKKYDLVETIRDYAKSGNPFLGICLGMQILFDSSEEDMGVEGLSIVKGSIKKIPAKDSFKIPHMGWNNLTVKHETPLTEELEGQSVYFVHSYFTDVPKEYIDVTADYGIDVPAMIHKDNVYGAQFHPEKSGDVGLGILKKFIALCEK